MKKEVQISYRGLKKDKNYFKKAKNIIEKAFLMVFLTC